MTMSPISLPPRTATVPDWLRQPPAIALLASLGVHGLLFALWPLLQSTPITEAVERRPVGVVTLTPAEVARLPATQSPLGSDPGAPGALPPGGSLLPPPTMLPPASLPNLLTLPPLLPGLDLPPAPVEPPPAPGASAKGSGTAAPVQTPPPATATPPQAAAVSASPSREPADPRLYAYDATGTDATKAYDQLATVVAEAQKQRPGLEFRTVEQPLELPLPTDACFDQVKPLVLAVMVSPAGKAVEPPQVLVSSGYPILNQRAAEAMKTRLYPLRPRTQLYVYSLQFKADADAVTRACAAARSGGTAGGQ